MMTSISYISCNVSLYRTSNSMHIVVCIKYDSNWMNYRWNADHSVRILQLLYDLKCARLSFLLHLAIELCNHCGSHRHSSSLLTLFPE